MSEFIGSRISLISKSDIRYVGVLYEINSETSTVALEQVKSFGTEGRRGNSDEEIPGSDSIYEYIVFRGSDVKDLKIEEAPKEDKAPQPQVPNDPAILGSGSRPPTQPNQSQSGFHQQSPEGSRSNQAHSFQQPPFQPYQQYNQYQNHYSKGSQGPQTGFSGPLNGFPGYPGMPFSVPPGWYHPPGQGFTHPPGPFSPHQAPIPFGGPRAHRVPNQVAERQSPPVIANENHKDETPVPTQELQASTDQQNVRNKNEKSSHTDSQSEATFPPSNSKQDNSAAAAAAPPIITTESQASDSVKKSVNTSEKKKIVPAVPLATAGSKSVTKANAGALQTAQRTEASQAGTATQYQSATQAATAAVAAAMAKLPPAAGQKAKATDSDTVDNLRRKVNEMRIDDKIRHSGKPGTGGFAAGHRGDRGGRRGGHHNKSLEVPSTDFDFESANARFNKQELVKEAEGSIPGDTALPVDGDHNELNGSGTDVVIPPITETYSKSSFFDNISSEAKDRELAGEGKRRGGGPEYRHEERKKNFETFGMGSVESGGYRGGYRGRGGRGRGNRGGAPRGGGGKGSSGFRPTRRGEFDTANAAASAAGAGG